MVTKLTTTGIEPVYAVAYKRRYLTNGQTWKFQFHIDHCAEGIIRERDVDPGRIESASDLAQDYERRIKFQYDVQSYVDMAISSTINLPSWGGDYNNPDTVKPFANILSKYASGLRGFTCYPDSSRGGQPLVACDYYEAKRKLGKEFEEALEVNDACIGGVCGI